MSMNVQRRPAAGAMTMKMRSEAKRVGECKATSAKTDEERQIMIGYVTVGSQ